MTRQYVHAPHEVHSLAPDEMEAAVSTMQRAEALATEIEGNFLTSHGLALDLGRLLRDIIDKKWCIAVKGIPFGEWTAQTFVNADGRPLQDDAARKLARDYELISRYPAVEKAVREGSYDGMFTSRTAASYACRIAEISEWEKRAIEEFIKVTPASDDLPRQAKAAAVNIVGGRIFQMLKEQSSTELRDAFYALQSEIKNQGAKAMDAEWTKLPTANVVKAVHQKFVEVVGRIGKVAGEDLDPEQQSLTQQLERVAGFVEDTLDAFSEYHQGNKLPLQSLIEQTKGYK